MKSRVPRIEDLLADAELIQTATARAQRGALLSPEEARAARELAEWVLAACGCLPFPGWEGGRN